MGIPGIDTATRNVVQWAARGEWDALRRGLFEAHFEPVTDGLEALEKMAGERQKRYPPRFAQARGDGDAGAAQFRRRGDASVRGALSAHRR